MDAREQSANESSTKALSGPAEPNTMQTIQHTSNTKTLTAMWSYKKALGCVIHVDDEINAITNTIQRTEMFRALQSMKNRYGKKIDDKINQFYTMKCTQAKVYLVCFSDFGMTAIECI